MHSNYKIFDSNIKKQFIYVWFFVVVVVDDDDDDDDNGDDDDDDDFLCFIVTPTL